MNSLGRVLTLLFVLGMFVAAAMPLKRPGGPIDLHGEFHLRAFQLSNDFTLHGWIGTLYKVSHFAGFAGLYALVYLASQRRRSLTAWLTVLGVAVLLELEQGFVAGRSGQFQDLLPDMIGALMAWVGFLILRDARDSAGKAAPLPSRSQEQSLR